MKEHYSDLKKNLSDFCLAERADVNELAQKVRTPYNYCLGILEEAVEILEVMEKLNEGDSEFLDTFTNYYMNKMQEVINAV